MKDAFLELLNGHEEEERKRKLGFRKETLILEIRKREKKRRRESGAEGQRAVAPLGSEERRERAIGSPISSFFFSFSLFLYIK